MSERTRSENPNESTHDGTATLARLRCPRPVKMIAAVYLLLAVFNFLYLVFFVSTVPLAPLALIKVVLCIAVAIGLLNLQAGWRIFTLITSGLCVLVLPFYFLAVVFSSDVLLFVFGQSGIDSRVVIELIVALHFAIFVWVPRTLMLPDVKRAFESGQQQSG